MHVAASLLRKVPVTVEAFYSGSNVPGLIQSDTQKRLQMFKSSL